MKIIFFTLIIPFFSFSQEICNGSFSNDELNFIIGTLPITFENNLDEIVKKIDNNQESKKVIITPNPVLESLYFEGLKDSTNNIMIIDMLGKVIIQEEINTNSIDLSSLQQGQYIIVLNLLEKFKIIKK